MHTLRLLILAGLLAGLVPLQATAQPGQSCVRNPDTGIRESENSSGACFSETGGFSLQLFNEEGLVFAQNPTADDNQWERKNPKGKRFLHAVVDVPLLAYCSPATLAAGQCFFGSAEAFVGIGKVKLNAAVDSNNFFSCPLTARVTGEAVDGSGNVIELAGSLTLVPDEDEEFGCRPTVDRIDVSVVAD